MGRSGSLERQELMPLLQVLMWDWWFGSILDIIMVGQNGMLAWFISYPATDLGSDVQTKVLIPFEGHWTVSNCELVKLIPVNSSGNYLWSNIGKYCSRVDSPGFCDNRRHNWWYFCDYCIYIFLWEQETFILSILLFCHFIWEYHLCRFIWKYYCSVICSLQYTLFIFCYFIWLCILLIYNMVMQQITYEEWSH